MMKARKKPVVIDCFQYDGDLKDSEGYYYVPKWFVEEYNKGIAYYKETEDSPGELFVKTLEGEHHISVNDYVIKGVKGEIYACKPDIFEMTYDIVCDNEIDYQLTVEELDLIELALEDNKKYLNRLIHTFIDGEAFHGTIKQLLNTNRCISNKLQKQKEMLENER